MITLKTQRGIIILSCLAAISLWVSREQKDVVPDPVAGLDPKLDYVLRDFEMQFYDKLGQPTMNIRAPILRNDPKLKLGTIERPVILLNQRGAVWNLTSESATVTADKEYVRLTGNVQVIRHETASGNRAELNTREVQIEVTPQTASTDQPVYLFDGYNQLNAIGLELDMKTNIFKLKQQVKATYAVN